MNSKNLLDELIEELNKYPREMYLLNPCPINRAHTGVINQVISRFWGYWDGYVSEKLKYHRNNPKFILPKKKLNEFKINLEHQFGTRANECIVQIDLHQIGKTSFTLLINNLKIERGKISYSVRTNLEDLAIIFGYGYGMMCYMHQNNYFILSLEKINLVKNNLKQLLGKNAEKTLEICDKYIERNPDRLLYPNQNYTITNPNLFKDIYNEEVMYWLGWLCSDG